MKYRMTLLLLALFAASTLTACNTMAGAGKDISKAGETIHDEAVDCKNGDKGDECL